MHILHCVCVCVYNIYIGKYKNNVQQKQKEINNLSILTANHNVSANKNLSNELALPDVEFCTKWSKKMESLRVILDIKHALAMLNFFLSYVS